MYRLTLILAFLFIGFIEISAQAIPVEVVQTENGWTLLRGGEPYYIRGAGGQEHLEQVVANGGNSIRTWSAADAERVLDKAHELGLTVMVGLWMGQERQGFDYSDKWAVEDQKRAFRDNVRRLKDHPAVLCWGVGNEVDLFYTDFNVWDATEDICAMIHEEDPNHPTVVVTAGIDVAEIQMIMERAPSVDIMGFNTYGELDYVPQLVRRYGWEGPYIVTEWGTDGHWEVPKTTWGAPVEPTGTEKADLYRDRYEKSIDWDQELCLGSYAFLWGQKQETTPTWYGVFLEDGSVTGRVDAMADCWGGKLENRAPVLSAYKMQGKTPYESVRVRGGEKVEVLAALNDPDGQQLDLRWELLPESTDIKAGGDKESRPEAMAVKINAQDKDTFIFSAPKRKGAYRLFLYAYDTEEKAVSANFPFYVE
jgi:hypothetical protein